MTFTQQLEQKGLERVMPTIYLKKIHDFYQIFASDGDFFDECIGTYNIKDDKPIQFDNEKLSHWLMMGVIPTLEVISIITTYLGESESPSINTLIDKLKFIEN